jgi:PleD family two-component response regulator
MAIACGSGKAVSRITLSVGVATVIPERKSTPNEFNILIEYADRALYQARALGRNRTVAYAPDEFA